MKNRRKRERKKERSEAANNTSSGDEDHSRPKTATLKRPHILDESLKDKVDMTLTKKEFLAAVKLCTDAAVQRGHPNMRVKAIKNHQKSNNPANNNNNSPYMSKIIGKIKKKVISKESSDGGNITTEIRPKTTKLERPTIASLDLPQINVVKPQVVISKSLSR